MLSLNIPLSGTFDGTTEVDPNDLRFTQTSQNSYDVDLLSGGPIANLGYLNPFTFVNPGIPNAGDDWIIASASVESPGASSITLQNVIGRSRLPLFAAIDLLALPPPPPPFGPGGATAGQVTLLTGAGIVLSQPDGGPGATLVLILCAVTDCALIACKCSPLEPSVD